MASTAFRDSMNSLGWSRRDPDLPISTSSSSTTPLLARLQALNPFGNEGYVRLPTHENPGAALPAPTRREEEEGWFACKSAQLVLAVYIRDISAGPSLYSHHLRLSRWDRLLVFGACNLGALACFVLCFALWPLLIATPTKFAILWTFGSVFFLASWAVLMGPIVYLKHLTSGPRLPFTAAYFGSIGLTIYFSVGLHNTYLTLISTIVQLTCLLWYLVSYFPMGSTGLRFAASFGAQRAAAWMTG
ncbi:MAG: protein transport protein sft2 [Thelocarpon superellum]|nr:MAG: protein transport protein sft2 [Thelocarpon superellum]